MFKRNHEFFKNGKCGRYVVWQNFNMLVSCGNFLFEYKSQFSSECIILIFNFVSDIILIIFTKIKRQYSQ